MHAGETDQDNSAELGDPRIARAMRVRAISQDDAYDHRTTVGDRITVHAAEAWAATRDTWMSDGSHLTVGTVARLVLPVNTRLQVAVGIVLLVLVVLGVCVAHASS